ncbi:MAG: DoxX family protein [Empedobacter falsenii]
MKKNTKQNIARYSLGAFLVVAGITHLTIARKEFKAQVPNWVPLEKDDTVVYSGVVEIALGSSIILVSDKKKELVGKVIAGFFAAVFPGNWAQYKNHRNGFGLETDQKRLARLFLQPLFVLWAIKSTQK